MRRGELQLSGQAEEVWRSEAFVRFLLLRNNEALSRQIEAVAADVILSWPQERVKKSCWKGMAHPGDCPLKEKGHASRRGLFSKMSTDYGTVTVTCVL
jgi:hypothetical protein